MSSPAVVLVGFASLLVVAAVSHLVNPLLRLATLEGEHQEAKVASALAGDLK